MANQQSHGFRITFGASDTEEAKAILNDPKGHWVMVGEEDQEFHFNETPPGVYWRSNDPFDRRIHTCNPGDLSDQMMAVVSWSNETISWQLRLVSKVVAEAGNGVNRRWGMVLEDVVVEDERDVPNVSPPEACEIQQEAKPEQPFSEREQLLMACAAGWGMAILYDHLDEIKHINDVTTLVDGMADDMFVTAANENWGGS